VILVLTNREDLTADLGILGLRRRGLPYVRLNTEDVLPTLHVGSDGIPHVHLQNSSLWLDDVAAIWFRRPRYTSRLSLDPKHRAFVREETTYAWSNVFELLEDRVWVNHPRDNRRAANRLWVLHQAALFGLPTPATLMTTHVAEARSFVKHHGASVVKSVGPGYRDDDTGVASFSTLLASSSEVPDDLGPAPVLFQAYVDKVCDWRVTVFGAQVFSTRILSQAEPSGRVDWRQSQRPLRLEPATLPVEVQDSLLKLLGELNLRFAAVDFVEDEHGCFQFLEVNPNGQWGWIEQELGTPLSDGLAALMEQSLVRS
jgi:glutathione synthase/RimK-type ligase-like ATP-grasp enzyme